MTIEDDDKAAGAVAKAPRVAIGDIEAKISSCHFMSGMNAARIIPPYLSNQDGVRLHLLTICILVMKNGFTIVGKSAPASPDNFDRALGEKFARQDALRQAWAHEGYLLCERLATQDTTTVWGHASDCATHNAPAMDPGLCDCGATPVEQG